MDKSSIHTHNCISVHGNAARDRMIHFFQLDKMRQMRKKKMKKNEVQPVYLGAIAALMLMSDFRSWAPWKFAGRGGVTVAWTIGNKGSV